jgi:hypothetical protein
MPDRFAGLTCCKKYMTTSIDSRDNERLLLEECSIQLSSEHVQGLIAQGHFKTDRRSVKLHNSCRIRGLSKIDARSLNQKKEILHARVARNRLIFRGRCCVDLLVLAIGKIRKHAQWIHLIGWN